VFLNKIFGLKLKSINNYGKFIYWQFVDSDIVLFNTLGMTGWWEFDNMTHNNINIIFEDNTNIFFNDPRNFGNIILSNTTELNKKLNQLGADIFNKNDLGKFIDRLDRKRNDTMIATALLDQKVAAGCGNYLRAEALYIAKISPFREIKDLSKNEIITLWGIINQLAWFYYNEKKGRKLKIINDMYKLSATYKKSGPSKYKPDEGYFHVYRQKKDTYNNIVLRKETKS
jgi:formamidopyrimidine-DNA glycosylase